MLLKASQCKLPRVLRSKVLISLLIKCQQRNNSFTRILSCDITGSLKICNFNLSLGNKSVCMLQLPIYYLQQALGSKCHSLLREKLMNGPKYLITQD